MHLNLGTLLIHSLFVYVYFCFSSFKRNQSLYQIDQSVDVDVPFVHDTLMLKKKVLISTSSPQEATQILLTNWTN